MRIIFDARALRLYPVGQPSQFYGGTETMVHELAMGLALEHEVHVVCPDLEFEQRRGERLWYWGPRAFPTQADAVVMVHSLEFVDAYSADFLIYATNGIDPDLGPEHAYATGVDAFPIFSAKHGELLRQFRPTIREEQCFATGLGIDLARYTPGNLQHGTSAVPGRMLYANDPARGLWHVLDIFEHLKRLDPSYSLHIAYDFDRQFEHHRWSATTIAEAMWECRRRMGCLPDVVNVGGLNLEELVSEQLACELHVMPSDPPNVGSQIHGITQMECAAAGSALILSDIEAFPEVFESAALILPAIGTWLPRSERRYDAQDWAEAIHALRSDPPRLEEMGRKSRELASQNTWAHVIDRWQGMLESLLREPVAA